MYFSVSDSQEYKYWRILYSLSSITGTRIANTLQFFGKDYSEKEFEPGTNKKWLYDHGVELEIFTYDGSSTYKVLAENDGEAIHLKTNGGTTGVDGAWAKLSNFNLVSYDLMRLKVGKIFSTTSTNNNGRCASINIRNVGTTTQLAMFPMYRSDAQLPNNYGFDISSINDSYDVYVADINNAAAESTISELWLE